MLASRYLAIDAFKESLGEKIKDYFYTLLYYDSPDSNINDLARELHKELIGFLADNIDTIAHNVAHDPPDPPTSAERNGPIFGVFSS